MNEPNVAAAARMYELTTGAWVSQAIYVAAGIGVADRLAAGPRPVTEIAEETGTHAPTLYRLLRALADIGVFAELDGRRFALTGLGELLRGDVPGSMRSWAMMLGRPFHLRVWADLAESLRSGEPAFERVHGQSGFEYLRDHPEDGQVLNEAMTAASAQFIAPVVDSYDFGVFKTVVDVGGGQGALLAAVLAANPGVHGVLFDQPHVISGAGRPLEDAGVADRCERVGGDFFDSVPTGDAYLLSNVLHDWDDERCAAILASVREAMNDDGRVLLGEAVLPDAVAPHPAKWIDLEMLVMGGGRQRTEREYRELFHEAGLRLTRVIPTHVMFDLVEAEPR
jgi:O-methyltransferase domain/IclR helix-turn-helix domain